MMCHQKCSQINVRSWNSCPHQSKYQCTIMVWGTVFTNDCCRRLVGSITKVWQPFTSIIYTLGTCQTSMMCHQKCSQINVRSWNSCPHQSKYQCTIMVWGTVFTNDCCRRLVGSITKVWQPFTSIIYTLGTCQTSMMCHQKCSQINVRSWNSCPHQSKYQCTIMVWGTVFTNDCCRRLVGSITKVWQPFTSIIYTLGTCQTSMMCHQKCSQINVRSWNSCPFLPSPE